MKCHKICQQNHKMLSIVFIIVASKTLLFTLCVMGLWYYCKFTNTGKKHVFTKWIFDAIYILNYTLQFDNSLARYTYTCNLITGYEYNKHKPFVYRKNDYHAISRFLRSIYIMKRYKWPNSMTHPNHISTFKMMNINSE